ncbi:ER membrane protein complex subunit [Dirofilaria immitis]
MDDFRLNSTDSKREQSRELINSHKGGIISNIKIGRKVNSMAPQTASGKRPTSDNKTTKDVERVAIFSEVAMRHNIVVLEYSRTCQAASAGMASGILGLTGISGFIFYFVVVIFQALFWEMKANFEWQNYFDR